MIELIRNAWAGWRELIDGGKIVAVLIVALAYLWKLNISKRDKAGNNQVEGLLTYSTLMTIACMFPISAAVFMLVLTRFFDYVWVWQFVPVTAIIAFAITQFFTELVEDKKIGKKEIGIVSCSAIVCIFILFVSGRFGQRVWDMDKKDDGFKATEVILEELTTVNENTVVWAPKEILTNIRIIDGDIKLIYGRNMWDKALDAYSYDVYDDCIVEMYDCMEKLSSDPVEEDVNPINIELYSELDRMLDKACERGVNTIVFPKNTSEAELKKIISKKENLDKANIVSIEGYLVIYGI